MTEFNPDLLGQLRELLAQASPASPASPAAAGWNPPASPSTMTRIAGVGVPIRVNRGHGHIRLTLWLPAEAVASPQALNAALDALEQSGLPLDVYEPRQSWGGNNNTYRSWRK